MKEIDINTKNGVVELMSMLHPAGAIIVFSIKTPWDDFASLPVVCWNWELNIPIHGAN